MGKKLTKKDVIDALYNVIDMEIGLDIVNLGFVYGIDIDENNNVKVVMTLTTPGCPLIAPLQEDVVNRVKEIGANDVIVDIVWDPPWNPSMMSEEARKKLLGE
ncbi:metal-sulfur cluster assembly factor [Hippea alviniae]|uniref:metal-sulfur cluster assembly factor n=1 Tax=Hippea alviniae TaxID=1279027 RepID=UPI0003B6158A|nr:metal-sulfur cluster assembly factor [Hippea alviniae]